MEEFRRIPGGKRASSRYGARALRRDDHRGGASRVVGALRRPRAGLIPRLPPARLLSGLTSFWPDCRRDFSSAFARRFEFCLPFSREYSRLLTFPPIVARLSPKRVRWLRRTGRNSSADAHALRPGSTEQQNARTRRPLGGSMMWQASDAHLECPIPTPTSYNAPR